MMYYLCNTTDAQKNGPIITRSLSWKAVKELTTYFWSKQNVHWNQMSKEHVITPY